MHGKCFLVLMSALLTSPAYARQKWPTESTFLKASQKRELQALKFKQEYARSLSENSEMPKAVRTQLRHKLKREERRLRQRQRAERQALKDRERLLKFELKRLETE